MKVRAGYGLIELLTTTALLGIVSAAAGLLIHAQARLLHDIAERAAIDETLRSASSTFAAEVNALDTSDVRAVSSDSVALRVFRGWGIVCASNAGRNAMRYRGMRAPDAEKDSLLLVGAELSAAFRLIADPWLKCAGRPDEQVLAIAPSVPLRVGSLVLIFESGSFHLSANALRYRRGAEGRQPLTDELIDHRRSRFIRHANGVRVQLNARK